jgi:sulfite reductase (NADPH) hemoprotein beta-component
MYQYDHFDQDFVDQRVTQFRDQVRRRLSGELSEDEFKPLRLTNGLYLQLHAYMLRVAIPYGTLNAVQMRMLAHIARRYDRGYGHFTTRQNIQFNWFRLEDAPDALADLASVQMHALQTSGNVIRNTTADQWAGVALDEIEDPRIWCEIIRQWSSLHPEFSFLPRKFKIAVTGSPNDRAAVRVHDIGLRMHKNLAGEIGFEVMVGGGLGRTPLIGKTIAPFLPKQHLLSYLEAIMRVYNQAGRRDNIYKARIKILVHEIGVEEMRRRVELEWESLRDGRLQLDAGIVTDIEQRFAKPVYEKLPADSPEVALLRFKDKAFGRWMRANVVPHIQPGYAIVNISLKPEGEPPGDATAEQMDAIADLADAHSLSEIRVTHAQNLVLPHVQITDLPLIFARLQQIGLAADNIGQVGDIIACPGLDFCALANARSIPVAQRISRHFADAQLGAEIGDLQIKISGCINACGHHHVGHIGILGVDKHGEEFYQITLGGSAEADASIGTIIGPAVAYEDVVGAIDNIVRTYLDTRAADERFLDTVRRVGISPFKERLYAAA